VADDGQAWVPGITGDRRGLAVLREMTSVDAHRRTQDLVSDRPGRSFESASAPAPPLHRGKTRTRRSGSASSTSSP
jgi:hypothetical protein